ncbi:MAG: CBS domain-containing protein [Candidatus Scalindua sp.]|jgi:dTDP-glucose pyrophosphorylase/predicted transcriptional regulator|nr:CBS domain-containing protein [Candidatus Scalindua sp.]
MLKNHFTELMISKNISIKDAIQKLNETGVKILFVVSEDNRLLGTVTDGDLRRGIVSGIDFSDKAERIMHEEFIAISDKTLELDQVAKRIMIEKKIEQIPVIDSDGVIRDIVLWIDILGEVEPVTASKINSNSVLVMAGGKGTRLDPFTKILPKPLIPIGNKPVIELIMEKFYKYGFNKFIYSLNYKKEFIKVFLKENNFPYSIDWIEEEDFLGTAGSISLLKDKVQESFFVTNCDTILDVNFMDILEWHKEHKASITIIGSYNEVKIPFGVLEMSDGKLDRILEKPVHDLLINSGVYVMEPHVLSYIAEGMQVDMNQLIETVARKEKVSVYPIYNGWLDIGQWDGYNKGKMVLEGLSDV